jgi:osmoprotectant transport system substrate-binding protein
MKQLRIILAMLALALAVGLAACGDDDDDDNGGGQAGTDTGAEAAERIQSNPDNAGTTITVGSKNFTEQKILGEIFAQGLEAAGYKVEKELNLGDEKTALAALEDGEISAYPEYTGTALLSFFEVPSEGLPSDPQQAYEQARDGFAERDLTAFPPTPFTSSNEVAMTKETQERLGGITKISELEEHAGDLTLYGSPECRQRRDCLLGLQDVYGLEFRRFVPVAIDLRHQVLEQGRADLSIVFTTDPQIQRNQEVLLEDDKGMFPPYNSTLVVRNDVVEQAGDDLPRVIEQVEAGLTDEVMQELNARVDLDKETPEAVATAYLRESGLIG